MQSDGENDSNKAELLYIDIIISPEWFWEEEIYSECSDIIKNYVKTVIKKNNLLFSLTFKIHMTLTGKDC